MKFATRVDVETPADEVFARLADFPGYVRKAEAPQEPPRLGWGGWRPADGLILLALGLAVLGLFF